MWNWLIYVWSVICKKSRGKPLLIKNCWSFAVLSGTLIGVTDWTIVIDIVIVIIIVIAIVIELVIGIILSNTVIIIIFLFDFNIAVLIDIAPIIVFVIAIVIVIRSSLSLISSLFCVFVGWMCSDCLCVTLGSFHVEQGLQHDKSKQGKTCCSYSLLSHPPFFPTATFQHGTYTAMDTSLETLTTVVISRV